MYHIHRLPFSYTGQSHVFASVDKEGADFVGGLS